MGVSRNNFVLKYVISLVTQRNAFIFATKLGFLHDMAIQKLKKILEGHTISFRDLSVTEKKALYSALTACGMSRSTCYLRLYKTGFEPWEIMGVTKVSEFFLAMTSATIDKDEKVDDEGSRGYGYVRYLDSDRDLKAVYPIVIEQGMLKKFIAYMYQMGIHSPTTVRNRFNRDNWAEWERRGIKQIIETVADQLRHEMPEQETSAIKVKATKTKNKWSTCTRPLLQT